MNLTKSAVESVVRAASAALPTIRGNEPIIEGEDVVQGNLHSLLIGSLGKLVSLSSQLKLICGGLADKVRESGKPITGSNDLSKINSLFADVDRAFGAGAGGERGFSRGLEQMLTEMRFIGGAGVPQVERLTELYAENMYEAHEIIGKLQRNEYTTNLESVFIPKRSQAQGRAEGRADGTERQEWTGEEYRLMLQLRELGLLRGDDFTTAYEGRRGDDSTVSSGELEPDEYSYSSRGSRSTTSSRARNVFRPSMYVPRYSRRGYEKEGDSDSSVFSDDDSTIASENSGMNVIFRDPDARVPDSDDDTDYSGSGLYSIPASTRFPQRIF
jgi:hypothetical protein